MRWNRETTAFMNDLADLAGRFAFQIGKSRADAEEVSLRRGDFDAGDDEKVVHRQAVFAHQALLEEVGDRVAGVVIGDRNAMKPFLARRGDVLLGARHAVARKERVGVEFDVERHCGEASLQRSKWKAAV